MGSRCILRNFIRLKSSTCVYLFSFGLILEPRLLDMGFEEELALVALQAASQQTVLGSSTQDENE